MELGSYVENLRRELAVAAEAGGEEARALAERLTAPLESALRLALLEALSAAADEITRDLAPGSVDVRLRGRDPEFVVTRPPGDHAFDPDAERPMPPGSGGGLPAPPVPPNAEDGGGTSRISLRIPEHLKPRIEEAARKEGLSVNSWLVRAISAALDFDGGSRQRTDRQSTRPYTGWVR
ncbi:HicB family protein [Sinosporangium album]|uniref:HicB family protein n=1 Tax=Sinosporangium album TaxID=504805 RepID=A0A1G8IH44_9ACTN|nr:toxin-antitoxin system HicB family antitoxin [Sinosporangium album]SDI18358.1 HicB family protein [Sinosporangium album]